MMTISGIELVKVIEEEDKPTHWRMGTIEIRYLELVAILGLPMSDGDGYKVDCQWNFRLESGHFVIWNYKNGPNYTKSGTVEGIVNWSFFAEHPGVMAGLLHIFGARLFVEGTRSFGDNHGL